VALHDLRSNKKLEKKKMSIAQYVLYGLAGIGLVILLLVIFLPIRGTRNYPKIKDEFRLDKQAQADLNNWRVRK